MTDRFPQIKSLFECLLQLQGRVVKMRDATKALARRSQMHHPEHLHYSAPPTDYSARHVRRGGAREEGRCRVVQDPTSELLDHIDEHFEGSVDRWKEHYLQLNSAVFDSWAHDLDDFHVEFRAWRTEIEAVRTAIDSAADELDQGGKNTKTVLEFPSVQARAAVDELARAVPYSPELSDDENYPLVHQSWADAIEKQWPAVARLIYTYRRLAHMLVPTQIDGVVRQANGEKPSDPQPTGSDEEFDEDGAILAKKPSDPPNGSVQDVSEHEANLVRTPESVDNKATQLRVRVDTKRELVIVGNRCISMTGDALRMCEHLVRANGATVQGYELQEQLMIARADRIFETIKKALPDEAQNLFLSKRGAGGGYRLNSKYLEQ